ncbi:MAG: lipid-A-disaccharide synthase [Polyangiaceae bacterium]
MSSLLVVAGEASGDRAAAAVLARLPRMHTFGMGGRAMARAGVDLVSDLCASTALGVGEPLSRSWEVLRAWRAVLRAARVRKPRAALLVNYTEFNMRVAPRLHAAGVPVVWYGAPQVWAWRPQRTRTLRRFVDRMAVMLPFEEALWRAAGVDAHYVGHPAVEGAVLDRASARIALGMTPYAAAIAVLPGSRPHEVRRLLVPMLDAYESIRADRASVDARVLVAPSLDEITRAWLIETCAVKRVTTFDVDPTVGAVGVLRAFDASLCASGTGSLEAALARAVPIVSYRVGVATELTARALLSIPNVALPNVLLGRRAFPELVQRDATPVRIAAALADVLDRRDAFVAACREVEAALGDERTPSLAVARMLMPMLGVRPTAALSVSP